MKPPSFGTSICEKYHRFWRLLQIVTCLHSAGVSWVFHFIKLQKNDFGNVRLGFLGGEFEYSATQISLK